MGDTAPYSSQTSSFEDKAKEVDYKKIVTILCKDEDLCNHFYKLYASLQIRHPNQRKWEREIKDAKSSDKNKIIDKVCSTIILTWVSTYWRKATISTLVNALNRNNFKVSVDMINDQFKLDDIVTFIPGEGPTGLYNSFYHNPRLIAEVSKILAIDQFLDGGLLSMTLGIGDQLYKPFRFAHMLGIDSREVMFRKILDHWIFQTIDKKGTTPAHLCSILEKEKFRMLRDTIVEKLDVDSNET